MGSESSKEEQDNQNKGNRQNNDIRYQSVKVQGRAPSISKFEPKPKKEKPKPGEEIQNDEPEIIAVSTFKLSDYDLQREEHDYKKLLAQMKHLCY